MRFRQFFELRDQAGLEMLAGDVGWRSTSRMIRVKGVDGYISVGEKEMSEVRSQSNT